MGKVGSMSYIAHYISYITQLTRLLALISYVVYVYPIWLQLARHHVVNIVTVFLKEKLNATECAELCLIIGLVIQG